ncbi:MAG: hypothetical protein JNJ83_05175 [Verrucomicrobiaceae bacterium]|nr:hypothetical protein [Verrucomicrobiaceae bacterium]
MASISLTALRDLWEKSLPKSESKPEPRPVPPPAEALLQKLHLDLKSGPETCSGTLEVDVIPLQDGWHRLKLAQGTLSLRPTETNPLIEAAPDGYSLLTQANERVSGKIEAHVPPFLEWTPDSPLKISLSPAASRSITITGLPPHEKLLVNGRSLEVSDNGTLRLLPLLAEDCLIVTRLTKQAQPTFTSQAVVTQLTCQQRLVMDGGCLTTTHLSVRHHTEFELALQLPPEAEVLQCLVAGKPSNTTTEKGILTLQLSLSAREADLTKIELSCFSKLSPFSGGTGKVQLQTPASALFHESLEWNIELPNGLKLASLNTNTEAAQKVQGMGRISLKRSLWRNDPPTAEIFYQPANP